MIGVRLSAAALTQHFAHVPGRENAEKTSDAGTDLELGVGVFVEPRHFIDRHLRFLGQGLDGSLVMGLFAGQIRHAPKYALVLGGYCALTRLGFEATLVLFGCDLACEEGQKQLLQLLLLDEITCLTLMNQQHGVCEGVAQLGFLDFR